MSANVQLNAHRLQRKSRKETPGYKTIGPSLQNQVKRLNPMLVQGVAE